MLERGQLCNCHPLLKTPCESQLTRLGLLPGPQPLQGLDLVKARLGLCLEHQSAGSRSSLNPGPSLPLSSPSGGHSWEKCLSLGKGTDLMGGGGKGSRGEGGAVGSSGGERKISYIPAA